MRGVMCNEMLIKFLRPLPILALPLISNAALENSQPKLPDFLVKLAETHNCQELESFYDAPGGIEPYFAFGYLESNSDSSAVFWCKNLAQGPKYKLIIWADERFSFTCSTEIHWKNYPKGLSFTSIKKTFPGTFRYLDNPKKIFPLEKID
jgi:hypothetical protein